MKTKYNGDFTCFDLETTGLSVHTAEIIEISAIKVRNFETVDKFSSLVKPTVQIGRLISMITGITNDDVADAPQIGDILDDFLNFIGDDILIGHNIARYDLPLMRRICEEHNRTIENKYEDTLLMAQKQIPKLENYRLDTLCEYFGVVNEGAHRALNDVSATIKIYIKLAENAVGDINRVSPKSETKPNSSSKPHKGFSANTLALREFTGIIKGLTCDNILNEKKIRFLKEWLDSNSHLNGTYSYDVVYAEISKALENETLQQQEQDRLIKVLCDLLNPVETKSECLSDISFCGKNVCITGEFEYGTRAEVIEKLRGQGAVIKDTVINTVDYLIVGGCGSDNWACGNYGSKVKKALELQEKGRPIKILKETDVFLKVME